MYSATRRKTLATDDHEQSASRKRSRNTHAPSSFESTAKGRSTKVINSANQALRLHRLRVLQAQLLQIDPDADIIAPDYNAQCGQAIGIAGEQGTSRTGEDEDGPEQDEGHDEQVADGVWDPIAQEKPWRPSIQVASAPTLRAQQFFSHFQELLPSLVEPYLEYWETSGGGHITHQPSLQPLKLCSHHPATRGILCISQYSYETHQVSTCDCIPLAPNILRAGYFPSSPVKITIAFSIDLLDFYYHLYEQSSDATTSLAAALVQFLDDRDYPFLDSGGQPIDDPIRRCLGNAILWYDLVRLEPIEGEHRGRAGSDDVPSRSDNSPHQGAARDPHAPTPSLPTIRPGIGLAQEDASIPSLQDGECLRRLQDRCPACFAGLQYGRPHEQGSDIHLAVDANFLQRHSRTSGETPTFYEPSFFISKTEVDEMGTHIGSIRKKPKNPHYVPKVPDIAVDACQKTFDAADPTVQKTKEKKFDDMGVVALICRHDVPLYLCNIDTPGEDQKYAFALVSRVFREIPKTATVTVFYDIGCVLDRSMNLYPILPPDVTSRLRWATTAMHAYGHEWPCQLAYNPRLLNGMGLTDGEGVERLWSGMKKLIPVTRSSGRKKRIYLLDRRAHHIAGVKKGNLGAWIRHRSLNNLRGHLETAKQDVATSKADLDTLRKEWAAQQLAQKSLRAHAPAKLKQSLQCVMNLQETIERTDHQIEDTRKALSAAASAGGGQSQMQMAAADTTLQNLCNTQRNMVACAEDLYHSLNVQQEFPSLEGITFEFVNVLLAARDIKINIRSRLIGRFFEMSRIDQAIGGADAALGTKLHQASRANISKRTPAIISAVKKFNDYCLTLARLAKPEWDIPVPRPLPTTLDALKDDPYLYEDVWIEKTPGGSPAWLSDKLTRQGIKGLLRMDRCAEEKVRLRREASNLSHWYGRQLLACTIAHEGANREGSLLRIHLQRRLERTHRLRFRWSNPFTSPAEWDRHTEHALDITHACLRGQPQPIRGSLSVTQETSHPQFTVSRNDLETGTRPTAQEPAMGIQTIARQRSHLRIRPGPIVNSAIAAALDDAEDIFEGDEPVSGGEAGIVHTLAELGIDDEDTDDEYTVERPPGDKPSGPRVSSEGDIGTPIQGGVVHVFGLSQCSSATDSRRLKVESLKDTCFEIHLPETPCSLTACYGNGPQGFTSIDIPPQSLWRLVNVKGQLDDLVINSMAAVLSQTFDREHQGRIVLSTYLLSSHREGCAAQELWHHIERARKQSPTHNQPNKLDHGQWIIPIHRPWPEHWTLVTFDFSEHSIVHFDSYADPSTRSSDTQAALALVTDLLGYATSKGEASMPVWSSWTIYSALSEGVQTNGYDCGVWVLAQLLALIKGFKDTKVTGLREYQIPRFRNLLSHLASNSVMLNSV